MSKLRKVMIVTRLSGTSGRDILSGIFLFARQNASWHTRIFQMPDDLRPEIFRALVDEGYDGLIASEPGQPETAALIRDSSIPVSFIGDPGPILGARRKAIRFCRNDDEEIGRLGARHLVSLCNFASFGFIPTTSTQYWSLARQHGFSEELVARKLAAEVFRSPAPAGSAEDLAALSAWLRALPKPAGVMAAWDTRAIQAIQQCETGGIRVPEQVSVIGVDNDTLLAESISPALSSIQPDHERLGFMAARELHRLLAGIASKTRTIPLARPLRIVERESAKATAPATHLLQRANDYILKNAVKGLTPEGVALFLGVSRRLLDLRFHQFRNETVNEAIIRCRLDAVKKMLATTSRPIKAVSVACGYTDLAYLKTLFKRRFGMTMREWRASNHG